GLRQRMNIPRKIIVIAGLAAIPLVAVVGFVVLQSGNDFHCGRGERKAMSEFPHYDGAEAHWESNFKITGGCTTSYTVEAELPVVLSYYQEHLRQRGWAVTEPAANSFPSSLQAERGPLRFYLGFEESQISSLARLGYPPAEATALAKRLRAQQADVKFLGVKEGQTRVSISGGHKH
ncbi:MAG: hypothetical protein ABIP13_11570, partial [Tepidiformaceae bacterium]